MSLQFSDATNYRGIVQVFEKEIGAEYGDVSGNTTKLKSFTADVNLAFDEFLALAFRADGRWQFDDSNHTDYPIITTNLVSGQRDYTFTTDETGNVVLEVDRVLVADDSGIFHEVQPVDVATDGDVTPFYGTSSTGVPARYDKLANGIFLDPIPNYNETNGLKVYINREASYFTYTDTTKKPGVPGLFHRYFAIRPAYDYARRNSLAVLPQLQVELIRLEQSIGEHFTFRNADERKRMTVISNNR